MNEEDDHEPTNFTIHSYPDGEDIRNINTEQNTEQFTWIPIRNLELHRSDNDDWFFNDSNKDKIDGLCRIRSIYNNILNTFIAMSYSFLIVSILFFKHILVFAIIMLFYFIFIGICTIIKRILITRYVRKTTIITGRIDTGHTENNEEELRENIHDIYETIKTERIEKEMIINDFITMKLEYYNNIPAFNIYIKGELFTQCKYLLLYIVPEREESREIDNIDELQDIFNIDNCNFSIDEYADNYSQYNETNPLNTYDGITKKLTPNEEFIAHCSNIQAWAENDYDTRILHSNLSFPLLRKLTEVEDIKAKRVYKEEIIERIKDGYIPVIRYLIINKYLDVFSLEEIRDIYDIIPTTELKDELKTVAKHDYYFNVFSLITRSFELFINNYINDLVVDNDFKKIQDISKYIEDEIISSRINIFSVGKLNHSKIGCTTGCMLLSYYLNNILYKKEKNINYISVKKLKNLYKNLYNSNDDIIYFPEHLSRNELSAKFLLELKKVFDFNRHMKHRIILDNHINSHKDNIITSPKFIRDKIDCFLYPAGIDYTNHKYRFIAFYNNVFGFFTISYKTNDLIKLIKTLSKNMMDGY